VAVAFVQEFRIVDGDHSTTNYDAVAGRIDLANNPPPGLLVHTAGFDDDAGVFRVFDVWETREQGERFIVDHLMRVLAEMGIPTDAGAPPPDREGWYELHDVFTS
jgi:hypothetical protein